MAFNTQIRGILWVKNYAPPLVTLGNSGMCAEGFYSTLQPQGWYSIQQVNRDGFMHGDNPSLNRRAHDTDIQMLRSRPDPSGHSSQDVIIDTPGQDFDFAEKVDILYFCGHGDPGNIYFDQKAPVLDSDDIATYDDIRLGDNNVIKWLVLDACQVLKSDGIFNRWAKIFSQTGSLRYIFGFHSICKNDNVRGRIFAEYLNPIPGGSTGELMRIAWQYACEDTENGEWAILRAGGTNSPLGNDRWTTNSLPDDQAASSAGTKQFTYQKRFGPVTTNIEILN